MVATQIQWLAHKVGVEISRYRRYNRRRAHRIEQAEICTVVDVGANRGQYATDLRRAGYAGRIISLEPVADAYAELARLASNDDRWDALNVAAGAEQGELEIRVASNHGASSSFLPMSDGLAALAPGLTFVGSERVQVRRLDEVIDAEGPVLCKLDVQGYETHVLDGAARTLELSVLVECELSLADIYEGQASLAEMVARLDRCGFSLIDLDPIFRDPQDGRVLAFDGLFARRG